MNSFLQRVAQHILNQTPYLPHEKMIVLPNKRACMFLRIYLTDIMKPGQWLPAILTIEEAIELWSGRIIADRLALKFLLIEVFIEKQNMLGQNIKAFIAKADELLNDFEDVDQQMADPKELFQYLTEAKAVELWHPDGSPLTEAEQRYLELYQSLLEYYTLFKNKLSGGISGYKGMLARSLAEDEELSWFHGKPFRFCIFAGFNALTRAEQSIFTNLSRAGHASLLWDLDTYYMEPNRFQSSQAGLFLRKFKDLHPDLTTNWVGNSLLGQGKNIEIIGTPGNVSQAKALGQLLLEKYQKGTLVPDRTAVVLADENLLIPVLNSIPAELGSYNITMGLPFKQNPAYALMNHLFELVSSIHTSTHSVYFSTRALSDFFSSTIFTGFKNQSKPISEISIQLKSCTSGAVSLSQFVNKQSDSDSMSLGTQIMSVLDQMVADQKSTQLGSVSKVLNIIGDHLEDYKNEAAKQLIYAGLITAERLLNRIGMLVTQFEHLMDEISLPQLVRSLSASQSVNLRGEPVKGLQIMGLLETRSLDFDHVFVLSANEGILPSTDGPGGFISYDIRMTYGLHGPREQQAVTAYHFFRLLQSPGNIYLMYNTEPNFLGGGEKSRYILQITKELASLNPLLNITEKLMGMAVVPPLPAAPVTVDKTSEILALLKQKAQTGFSPTSLSNYVVCPLKFFLTDIASIREYKDPGADTGMEVLGNIVHEALRDIYQPFLHKAVDPLMLQNTSNELDHHVSQSYERVTGHTAVNTGKTALVLEVARQYIKQFINSEISSFAETGHCPVLISLEEELSANLNTSVGEVRLKGTPDRIEKIAGEVHIVDYKTGKLEKNELTIREWTDLIDNNKMTKSLQLSVYVLLFLKNNESNTDATVRGKIMGFRSLQKGYQFADFPDSQQDNNIRSLLVNIEQTLIELIERIFDLNQPFIQTNDTTNCRYCHFKTMCNR
jgi:hypothetical protein